MNTFDTTAVVSTSEVMRLWGVENDPGDFLKTIYDTTFAKWPLVTQPRLCELLRKWSCGMWGMSLWTCRRDLCPLFCKMTCFDTTAIVSTWWFWTKCGPSFIGQVSGKLLVNFGVHLSQDDTIAVVSFDKIWRRWFIKNVPPTHLGSLVNSHEIWKCYDVVRSTSKPRWWFLVPQHISSPCVHPSALWCPRSLCVFIVLWLRIFVST